ncbi:MAG: homocysteine S-methyltransferase [Caldilineaceae bacterium]|nr:homocysteine S-methyltransferase [Caldilineaceae bacterium]
MNVDDPLQPFFANQRAVILDGGLATELEWRGADLHDELWSARLLIENPASIRQLHLDYFLAGADVAVSASYQASFEGFARRGLSRKESAALLESSVRIAQQARDHFWEELRVPADREKRKRPLVAASVGSYGAYLADGSEYRGDYSISDQELREWHRPRLEALLAAEPDLVACETIPCLQEGEVLVGLLDEYRDTPAWLSFSCRDGSRVCSGERFDVCVELANSSRAIVAAGLNCTAPRYAELLLRRASRVTDKPLVCYPNSGETWDSASNTWTSNSDKGRFTDRAVTWNTIGARLIGGCCRTSPNDIRALAALLVPSDS